MDQIRITGGRPLHGAIPIGGAKNAALKVMVASLLTDQPLKLTNLPNVADITTMAQLLAQHGVQVDEHPCAPRLDDGSNIDGYGRRLTLTARAITSTTAPYDLVRKMRASVLVMGPLVARCGAAEVSMPGGCAIGTRPVDLHLSGLEQLGAEIELDAGYIKVRAPKGLTGTRIVFPYVSVGATENLMMAATLASGETQLVNAAQEPEIGDLAACLVAMGAEIDGIGTSTLTIRGVDRLGGAEHKVIADRIEAGTYAMAAIATGGEVELLGPRPDTLEAVLELLRNAGAEITVADGAIRVARQNGRLAGVDVMTEPFPGFPTDLQAQFMATMATAEGAAMITETIFENRFMHVPELARMGANVTVHGASALVRGVGRLAGAPVMASDLRASASLVIAGLAAEGETLVNRVYHLDRGYERLEQKLAACGAEIERVKPAA